METTYSLTSTFRKRATPQEIQARKVEKALSNNRNKQNQRAIAEWHRACRASFGRTEIPFPVRGVKKNAE